MFVFIMRYILAAGITFAVIFVTAPIAYTIWYGSLRSMNSGTLLTAGDLFFANFQIMSFVVPGIIIMWGFLTATRKRVSEEEDI